MMLESDDEERAPVPVKIHQALFDDSIPMPDWKTLKGSQSFDYGYCLTTHKSQGSQWETGLIYDESYCFRDDKFKWLYTAVTRFSDKLTLVRN
jgi:exodeoxyribonuclease-5